MPHKDAESRRVWLAGWVEKNRDVLRRKAHRRYLANRAHVKRQAKLWAKNNRERKRRVQKAWYAKFKDTVHRDRMYRRFGITLEDYERLYKKQRGRCAICGRMPKPGEKRLAVDHCHKRKHVRGLLCASCNNGLGRFKDSPKLLRAAARYLER